MPYPDVGGGAGDEELRVSSVRVRVRTRARARARARVGVRVRVRVRIRARVTARVADVIDLVVVAGRLELGHEVVVLG